MSAHPACRLLCTSPGAPLGGLKLEHFTPPSPQPGQALVEMLAAPIHPADINALEGTYGVARPVPFTPGNEAVGRVVQTAPPAPNDIAGKKVLLPYRIGTWASHILCEARDLIPVPENIPDTLAAQALINPLTALCLLETAAANTPSPANAHPEQQQHKKILAQNAANSAVGLCIIQLAPRFGLDTLNIVRRPEAAKTAAQHGAQKVLLDENGQLTSADIRAAAAAPIPVGLNAVGGASATTLAGALADGGTLITYGAMSRQALKIPASFLIFRDIRFCGFWLHRWIATASRQTLRQKVDLILEDMSHSRLNLPVSTCFTLSQFTDAITAAASGHSRGKVLFVHENFPC
jgi:NADPH:quinone reductase-like Zn-dependent oxidoreductase